MSINKKERLYYLDNAKGLASILGVFFHVGLMVDHNYHGTEHVLDLSYFISYFNAARMPLFLFIAGYFTYYSIRKYSLGKYVTKRLERIGIPLLFGFLLILPLDFYLESMLLAQRNNEPFTWGGYFSFLNRFKFDHLWFLYHILIFSFVTILFRSVLANRVKIRAVGRRIFQFLFVRVSLMVIIFSGLIALARKIGYFTEFDLKYINLPVNNILYPLHTLFAQFVIFLLGAASLKYSNYSSERIITGNKREIFRLAALYVACVIVIANFSFAGDSIIRQLMVVSLLFLVFNVFKARLNYTNRVYKYISDASYPFYILHYPWCMFVVYYYIEFDISTSSVLADYFILCIITTFFTYVSYSLLVKSNKVGQFIVSGIIPKKKKSKPSIE